MKWPKRSALWKGAINTESLGLIGDRIQNLHEAAPSEPITLFVVSGGGSSMTSFAFYDFIRAFEIPLHTVALGSVDSAAIIVYLSGQKRFVTPHTTMMFHLGRRSFDQSEIALDADLNGWAEETKHFGQYYKEIVSTQSQGKISIETVEEWEMRSRVLTPVEMVEWGVAHEILSV